MIPMLQVCKTKCSSYRMKAVRTVRRDKVPNCAANSYSWNSTTFTIRLALILSQGLFVCTSVSLFFVFTSVHLFISLSVFERFKFISLYTSLFVFRFVTVLFRSVCSFVSTFIRFLYAFSCVRPKEFGSEKALNNLSSYNLMRVDKVKFQENKLSWECQIEHLQIK